MAEKPTKRSRNNAEERARSDDDDANLLEKSEKKFDGPGTALERHGVLMKHDGNSTLAPLTGGGLDVSASVPALVTVSEALGEASVVPRKDASAAAASGAASFGQYGPRQAYDPDVADDSARFKKLLKDDKFWHAVRAFGVFCFSAMSYSAPWRRGLSTPERDRLYATAVKKLLIELGPTFIKLGQFLSVRRDLLPVLVADELCSLQDRVPPFPVETLRQIVTEELGAPPENLFAYFDPIPMASASIGQVHRVQLLDGQQAVLKVQRQSLGRQFYRDLGLMRFAAKTGLRFDRFYQDLRRALNLKGPNRPARFDFRNWLEMADEFGRNLFSEIDYLVEGRNADRLRRLMRDRTDVRIPRVIWKHSGRRVLTLEYIEGIKIDRVEELKVHGIDPGQVGAILITCYLEQIILKRFFHADPHAGNLAVDTKGRLIIYDFGMVGEISEAQRRALLSCVLATVRRDAAGLVRSLVEMGVVRAGTNHDAIARALSPFLDYYAGKSLFDLDFRKLEHDIDTVVTERSLRLPANLAYILRAGSSLEGIARTLKSDFSFSQAVRPVVRRLVAMEGMESLSTLEGLMQLAGLAVSGLKRASRESVEIARVGRSNKKIASDSPAALPPPVKSDCTKCRKHAVEQKRLTGRLRVVIFIAIGYTVLSLGTMLLLDTTLLANYASPGFYLVIGNIILGGIMIWKIAALLRGDSKSSKSSLSEHGQRNGDKKC